MAIILYDLAGAEIDRRFSPFCWRTRMALAHKGLEVETVPWRFTEKEALPQPSRGQVPVIRDDTRVVHDSTAIADYLETQYPGRPSLFDGPRGRALTAFLQNWTDVVVLPGLMRFVALDIIAHCRPEDAEYFRRTREERFSSSLEAFVSDREARLPSFRASLAPLRRTVQRQDFLAGDAPAYADYLVFGAFQWARAISDFEVLADEDPIRGWRSLMLDLFDGLARSAPAYGA
jgi:glutathione S-transferase